MRAPQDEDGRAPAARRRTVVGNSHLTMSNSPDLLVLATRWRPRLATFASLTRMRVGGAPIRHPYILTSPQVAPGYFISSVLSSCAPLTPPLPSSGYTASNLDRAQGGRCAPGTSFPPASYEAFA